MQGECNQACLNCWAAADDVNKGPMEHIAQGKRSDTLGFPHSRVSTPCKGKSLNTHTPRRILRRMITRIVCTRLETRIVCDAFLDYLYNLTFYRRSTGWQKIHHNHFAMRTPCNVWQAFYLFNYVRDGYVTWEEEQYMHMVVNTTNPYDLAASSVY